MLSAAAAQDRREGPAPQSSADSSSVGGGAGKPPDIDWLMTGLAFIFPALGGGLFGYDIGATSGALVSLSSAATSGTDWCEARSHLPLGRSGLLPAIGCFHPLIHATQSHNAQARHVPEQRAVCVRTPLPSRVPACTECSSAGLSREV